MRPSAFPRPSPRGEDRGRNLRSKPGWITDL